MRSSDVTFRTSTVPMETLGTDQKQKEMDIIEIKYPDGKVVAFPADDRSPETGKRYRDMYPVKYKAFKNGHADPDHVKRLEREIEVRQNELNGLKRAPDDERLQENLGYGEIKPDEDPHSTAKAEPQPAFPLAQPSPVAQPEKTAA